MHLNFAVDLDPAQARGLTNKDVENVEQLMREVIEVVAARASVVITLAHIAAAGRWFGRATAAVPGTFKSGDREPVFLSGNPALAAPSSNGQFARLHFNNT